MSSTVHTVSKEDNLYINLDSFAASAQPCQASILSNEAMLHINVPYKLTVARATIPCQDLPITSASALAKMEIVIPKITQIPDPDDPLADPIDVETLHRYKLSSYLPPDTELIYSASTISNAIQLAVRDHYKDNRFFCRYNPTTSCFEIGVRVYSDIDAQNFVFDIHANDALAQVLGGFQLERDATVTDSENTPCYRFTPWNQALPAIPYSIVKSAVSPGVQADFYLIPAEYSSLGNLAEFDTIIFRIRGPKIRNENISAFDISASRSLENILTDFDINGAAIMGYRSNVSYVPAQYRWASYTNASDVYDITVEAHIRSKYGWSRQLTQRAGTHFGVKLLFQRL